MSLTHQDICIIAVNKNFFFVQATAGFMRIIFILRNTRPKEITRVKQRLHRGLFYLQYNDA